MKNRFHVLFPLLISLSAGIGVGQEVAVPPAASRVAFDVATIKPSLPDERERWNQSASHFVATGQTLTNEIEFAFGVRGYQLLDRPHWADSVRYDFVAKASDSDIEKWQRLASDQQMEQVKAMMQALLADRCGLKVHWEVRQQPVFALVIDKHGSKLKPVPAAVPSSEAIADGFLSSHGVSMTDLANMLGTQAEVGDREVLDKTGLNGFYNVSLRWKSVNSTSDSIGSSLFTVLGEELGLKLVARKAPVKVLVIDKLEQPSEN